MGEVRVAVIGARGIGRHHAKWYALCGCKVVAIVGTSDATVNEAMRALCEMFGFDGNGYTDCAEMLRRERPNAVSVCTPHNLHYEHTMLALSHGAHVLCEKPLVWDEVLSQDELLSQAKKMRDEAMKRNLILAVNLQYMALAEHLRRLLGEFGVALDEIGSFEMHMAARSVGRDESGLGLWMDLSAHPISLLMRLFPGHEFDEDSVEVLCADRRVSVRFELCGAPDSKALSCQLTVRRVSAGESIQRHLRLNGLKVEIGGREDESGIYRSCISCGSVEIVCEDFMHTSIRRFVEAVKGEGSPLCSADDGIRNLEWQLSVGRRILGARK